MQNVAGLLVEYKLQESASFVAINCFTIILLIPLILQTGFVFSHFDLMRISL